MPDRDFYYLIGVRIGIGDSAVQHSLWADTVEQEKNIWQEFLDLLETVNEPVLIHYGNYERIFLKQMSKRYGGLSGGPVEEAVNSTFNMLSFIFAQSYFPTYSNGLKEVASWLGFKWSSSESSGLQAISWREQWQSSGGCEPKRELINYNSEDCAALALVSEATAQAMSLGRNKSQEVIPCVPWVQAESLRNDLAGRYREFVSQISEFIGMTEAAHWRCGSDSRKVMTNSLHF